MTTVTIKDVAREAGVSVASVSRALNGTGGVTAETEKRIRDVATRLRYIPHGAARSLITRRTHTIGALLPDMYGEFFSELIRGIDLAARARGLHLLVSSAHDGVEDAAAALRTMRGRVDGMIILSPRADASFLHTNLPESLPTVLLNSPLRGPRYPVLNIDNHGGAYAMVRHLAVECGYRDIALVAGPHDNYDAQQREEGYRAAMAAFVPDAASRIVRGEFTEESGYRAGCEMMASGKLPRAVFAANDMMAIGCLYALQQAGFEVPRDIALAGFDDIPLARYITPSLTTIRVHIAQLGERAVALLGNQIDSSSPSSPEAAQSVATELILRSSCGARLALE